MAKGKAKMMKKVNLGVKLFMAILIVASLITFYTGVGMYMDNPMPMPMPGMGSPEPPMLEAFGNVNPMVSMLVAFVGFMVLLGSVSLAVGMNMFK